MDIRYPNITGATEAAQLQQVKSYLRQLVDQLNVALRDMGGSAEQTYAASVQKTVDAYEEKDTPVNTFNSIKALIIKSADIVQAYYDEISYRLSGVYVATSDFGEYTQSVSDTLIATSESLTQVLENIQTITSRVAGVENQTLETAAHIKSGTLEYVNGVPIIGLEIGQRNKINGVETFDKFARFTADRLSFYDAVGNEVAYISDKKLYITHVQITGTFIHGNFRDEAQPNGSVITKWIGG